MTEQKKQIFVALPDEISGMHPHGQFHFLIPGYFINFACEADEGHVGVVAPMAERLAEFLASDDPLFEFGSPHLPGGNYLTRFGASQIASVQPAWSKKVTPEAKSDGIELVDALSGVPLLRRPKLH